MTTQDFIKICAGNSSLKHDNNIVVLSLPADVLCGLFLFVTQMRNECVTNKNPTGRLRGGYVIPRVVILIA